MASSILTLFTLTFVILLLVIFAMSLGVILNKRAIKGSCGGIANVPGMEDYNSNCSCSNPCDKKRARMEAQKQEQPILPLSKL